MTPPLQAFEELIDAMPKASKALTNLGRTLNEQFSEVIMTDNLEFQLEYARARLAYFEGMVAGFTARVKELEAEKALKYPHIDADTMPQFIHIRRHVDGKWENEGVDMLKVGDKLMITEEFLVSTNPVLSNLTLGFIFEITHLSIHDEYVRISSSPVNLGQIPIPIALNMRRAYLKSEDTKE
jgi:hypothetical protein